MPRRPSTGKHLYFITDGDHVKIGRANNVHKRVQSLQSGNPKQIWLTDSFDNKGHKESELHNKLKRFRVRGEWFWLSDIVKDILQKFKKDNPQKIDIDDK